MKNSTFKLYSLKIFVRGDEDTFVCKHQLGENFTVRGENIIFCPEITGFSMYSLSALLPLLPVKQRFTEEADWITTDNIIACPDPNCGARFEIIRDEILDYDHDEATVVPMMNEERPNANV